MGWFECGESRIYFEDRGNGDPVLLLPGFASSIEDVADLCDALIEAGYRVIAAELPGSGRSLPQPRVYSATYDADDAAAFGALLHHLQTGPTHLIGHSDGGEVALLIAASAPDLARSVVAWGAAGVVSVPDGRARADLYDIIDEPTDELRGFRDYLVEVYGEATARATMRSFAAAMGEIVAAGGDVSLSRASDIRCPALLIAGEHDSLAPPERVAELAARMRAVTLLRVEGGGHSLHSERPEWMARTVLHWLEDQRGGD